MAPTMYPYGTGIGGMLSPAPHYYEIRGQAAEIARDVGSPVAETGERGRTCSAPTAASAVKSPARC
jgi:hypothetical protein